MVRGEDGPLGDQMPEANAIPTPDAGPGARAKRLNVA